MELRVWVGIEGDGVRILSWVVHGGLGIRKVVRDSKGSYTAWSTFKVC